MLPYVNNDKLFVRYEGSINKEQLKWVSGTTYSFTQVTNILDDNKLNLFNAMKVKYDFNRDKIKYYTTLGVFYKTALWTDYTRTLINTYPGSTNVYKKIFNGTSEFLKNEIGPTIGAGVKTKLDKKWGVFLDFNYLFGSGVISDTHFQSTRLMLNFGLELF